MFAIQITINFEEKLANLVNVISPCPTPLKLFLVAVVRLRVKFKISNINVFFLRGKRVIAT